MGERDAIAVGIFAIDIVKADRVLRHNFEAPLPRLEDLGVDGIAQGGDVRVNAAAHLLQDQLLGRGFRMRVNLDLIAALAQPVSASGPMSQVAERESSCRS